MQPPHPPIYGHVLGNLKLRHDLRYVGHTTTSTQNPIQTNFFKDTEQGKNHIAVL